MRQVGYAGPLFVASFVDRKPGPGAVNTWKEHRQAGMVSQREEDLPVGKNEAILV